MPSGSKRRKAAAAAKKKKEQDPTPSGSQATAFNGGEDVKGHESDGGDVNSPVSQDLSQSGGQSFNEGGDVESSLVRQIDSQNVNVEEGDLVDEVVIGKVEEDEGRVEITREFKLDEVEGSRGDLSVEVSKSSDSSSSSSSDDEEVNVEKSDVVQDLARVEEAYEVVESLESAEDFQASALVTENVVYVTETEAAPVEVLYEDLDNPVLSELKTTEEVLSELKTPEDDAPPAIFPMVISHVEASNSESIIVKDPEDNVLPPSDSPIHVVRNGVGHHVTEPEIQDSVDNQAPVMQAPLSVQRTSWKGCCGLFEVFTGSR